MLNKNTLVSVTNISAGSVVYALPELNIVREYAKGETKTSITVNELRALSFLPGGRTLIEDYLSIGSPELLSEFGMDDVPVEYSWTEEDIKRVLTTGSLEELEDALDFAPDGIKDLIKSLAVTLEIVDMSKREAILRTTGFNVTQAININKESSAPEVPEVAEKPAGRRLASTVAAEAVKPVRRITPKATTTN